MKRRYSFALIVIVFAMLGACAHVPMDRYNTQRGAMIGAGTGALMGQAIGGNTEGTLIGLAAGTILGALVGNAVDQDYQAARDAVRHNKPVVYYDRQGTAVEVTPQGASDRSNCRRVTKRVWRNGELISETAEEICEDPGNVPSGPAVVYHSYPSFGLFYRHHYPGYYYRHYPYHPRHHRRYHRYW